MKKITCKLLTMLLALFLLVPTFASCASLLIRYANEKERPMMLYELAQEGLNDLDSVTLLTKVSLKAVVSGVVVTSTVSSTEQIETKGDEFFHRVETQVTAKSDDTSTTVATLSGYQDGQMFYAGGTHAGLYTSEMKSAISAEDYAAHREKISEHSGVDIDFSDEECGHKISSQNEDGTWLGIYSDFEKSYIDRLVSSIYGLEAMFCENFTVADIVFTLTVSDEEYLPECIELELEFEPNDKKDDLIPPTLKIELEISEPDNTQIEKTDLADFKAVDDLRILELLSPMAEEFARQQKGKFISTTDISTKIGSELRAQSQRQTISFGQRENGYFYEVLLEDEELSYRITYEDGVQTTVRIFNGDENRGTTKKMRDAAAKYNVRTAVFPGDFQASEISDVKVTERGGMTVYILRAEAPATLKKKLENSLGSTCKDLSVTVEYSFGVKDGKLVEFDYLLNATFKLAMTEGTYTASGSGAYTYNE